MKNIFLLFSLILFSGKIFATDTIKSVQLIALGTLKVDSELSFSTKEGTEKTTISLGTSDKLPQVCASTSRNNFAGNTLTRRIKTQIIGEYCSYPVQMHLEFAICFQRPKYNKILGNKAPIEAVPTNLVITFNESNKTKVIDCTQTAINKLHDSY